MSRILKLLLYIDQAFIPTFYKNCLGLANKIYHHSRYFGHKMPIFVSFLQSTLARHLMLFGHDKKFII
ncbi:hypothetical protein EDM58_13500 [Brevibacillus panacihumi]|uniref:Uncharacterized protein n=1 Tax=Brevibacillus panacihumi TaxID=497735 RepID=A0A3M8CT43_9BACL|nr:hypothetical protein EDM58_13500 [Brevibacillus panacihumi]